jgi:hypothetical protein
VVCSAIIRGLADLVARIAAACGYLTFLVAPLWLTPHAGGPREYGFHPWLTPVANCYLAAGLAFLAYMARCAYFLLLTRWRSRPMAAGVRDSTTISAMIGSR